MTFPVRSINRRQLIVSVSVTLVVAATICFGFRNGNVRNATYGDLRVSNYGVLWGTGVMHADSRTECRTIYDGLTYIDISDKDGSRRVFRTHLTKAYYQINGVNYIRFTNKVNCNAMLALFASLRWFG